MEKIKGYQTTYIDIMVDGRFYKQIPYHFNPLWEIDLKDVQKEVLNAYPHLANKHFTMGFSNQRIARR